MASPAAAAAVSRTLKRAGIPRAVELAKGVESTGYVAEPHATHVRVEYVHFLNNAAQQRTGLAKCVAALKPHYEVEVAFGLMATPEGWRQGHYLKVTNPRWEA